MESVSVSRPEIYIADGGNKYLARRIVFGPYDDADACVESLDTMSSMYPSTYIPNITNCTTIYTSEADGFWIKMPILKRFLNKILYSVSPDSVIDCTVDMSNGFIEVFVYYKNIINETSNSIDSLLRNKIDKSHSIRLEGNFIFLLKYMGCSKTGNSRCRNPHHPKVWKLEGTCSNGKILQFTESTETV